MTKTVVTLFSGVGGSTLGAMQAGYTPVLSVEHSPKIAATYAANFGDKHLRVADVRAVDYKPFAGVDLFTASPVCTRFSVANPDAEETELDITCAQAVARALLESRPRHFVLENVAQYGKSISYKIITDALDALGYWWEASVLNAADFGVPQTRKRLIIRAQRNGKPLPFLRRSHSEAGRHGFPKWAGWHEALRPFLDNLEPLPLADWMQKRLPQTLPDLCLIEGTSAGPRPPTIRLHNQPSFVICAGGGGRVHRVRVNGLDYALDTHCMGNLQGFPASFQFAAKKSDACTEIGNAVPPPMMRGIVEAVA